MRLFDRRIHVRETAAAAAVLALAFAGPAYGADPVPGSGQGGSPGPSVPAGVKVGTELPSRISVDNSTEKTSITATVVNKGEKKSPELTLLVVGFDALKVTGVKGCDPIPEGKLPKGSNSGFSCDVGTLAAGKSRSYPVSATYDLQGKGKICLPVMGKDGALLWQQGPVPFGTSKPTPNAPDTPLLLGTDNVPFGRDSSARPSPSPSDTLPSTGAPDRTTVLALGGGLLLAAGGAGLWLTRRPRAARH
ncbi:LPXTG cell wall anchor domain-containing protein [Streptomyces sp. MI02-7b]|uniref:LPXTG cell wall anchor domain-containing protein n=1 Tax=Streptomyces sp. MI02-7b TaxID=462941 RepID=UPI0029B703D7|nr:LPXTG cell wall anchor domain-containing protein [Streptomyces sp. MI02-7b]MDX3074533.1 LPXTG cell wall anchor domain-containing protein [Streptomyces sp. MI02-7b]